MMQMQILFLTNKLEWGKRDDGRRSHMAIIRLFNHPDFVGIIPIVLENPESRRICDRDRKKLYFESCCDIFVKFS